MLVLLPLLFRARIVGVGELCLWRALFVGGAVARFPSLSTKMLPNKAKTFPRCADLRALITQKCIHGRSYFCDGRGLRIAQQPESALAVKSVLSQTLHSERYTTAQRVHMTLVEVPNRCTTGPRHNPHTAVTTHKLAPLSSGAASLEQQLCVRF